MPRLLILDCDGVLIRSERANLAYYNHLFGRLGLPTVHPEDRGGVSLMHTLSTPQVIDAFVPPLLRERAREETLKIDFTPFFAFLEVEPGWDDVLGRLRQSLKVAVATNRGASARDVLRGVSLLGFMDLVVTVRDVAHPKPHPDLLLAALAHFGIPSEDAVYVGDSEVDREAADRAGVPFLGFRTPFAPAVCSAHEVEARLLEFARVQSSASMATAGV